MSDPRTHTQASQLQQQLEATQRENALLRSRLGRQQRHRGRAFSAWALLLLGLLLVLPAQLLIWANRTFIDTNNYVKTVTPIIHEPSVQHAIVKSATDTLYANVDIQAYIAQLLPQPAQPLAGPITGQVKSYINSTIGTFVSSDRFATAWVNVNRTAHEQFLAIARSNGNPNVNLDQLYGLISQSFADTPLSPLAGRQLPPSVGQITVVTVPALQRIPHYVSTLSDLRWLIFSLAIGCLVLALVVSPDRRRLSLGIGLGWMAVTVLGLLGVWLARTALLAQIHDPVYSAAAGSVWTALLQPFYVQTAVLFITGAVIAAVGWLLGPARLAVLWRGGLLRLLGRSRHRWLPASDNAGWTRWLRRYHGGLLWLLLLLTIVALLMLIPLSAATLVLVIIVAAVFWLALEFLVAPTAS